MIYRVNKYFDQYGNPGPFVGYIALCHGYINASHIYAALLKSKMIHEDWIRIQDMTAVPQNSLIFGAHTYIIGKKTPRRPAAAGDHPFLEAELRRHPVEQLFVLNPLESIKEKVEAPAKQPSPWYTTSNTITIGAYPQVVGNYVYYHNLSPVQQQGQQQQAQPAQPIIGQRNNNQ